MKRVFAFLVLITVLLMSLCGCQTTNKYSTGYVTARQLQKDPLIKFKLETDKLTFPADDVSFDFSYGFFETSDALSLQNSMAFGQYKYYEQLCGKVFFAIYIYNNDFMWDNIQFYDNQNTENVWLVKTISLEEAISENYSFDNNFLNWPLNHFKTRIDYDHSEKLSFSPEILNKFLYNSGSYGGMNILVMALADCGEGVTINNEVQTGYYIISSEQIYIKYRFNSNGTVEFDNLYR